MPRIQVVQPRVKVVGRGRRKTIADKGEGAKIGTRYRWDPCSGHRVWQRKRVRPILQSDRSGVFEGIAWFAPGSTRPWILCIEYPIATARPRECSLGRMHEPRLRDGVARGKARASARTPTIARRAGFAAGSQWHSSGWLPGIRGWRTACRRKAWTPNESRRKSAMDGAETKTAWRFNAKPLE